MNDLPIGVFDSGVGGLTVLRSLAEHLPNEKFLYLADTARLPYGAKSADTIEHYLVQNVKFLLQEGVKAIVVACNSASTVLLAKKIPSPVPVLNVIQPGSLAALERTKNGRIGVMGTRATVLSQAYVHALQALRPEVEVFQQACPLLVPLIEENWIHDPLTNMVLYRYLQSLLKESIDVLIMGCTHYPILKEAIARVTGPNVTLVDASMKLAEDLKGLDAASSTGSGEIHIACTDLTPHLENLIKQLLSPLNVTSLRLVNVS